MKKIKNSLENAKKPSNIKGPSDKKAKKGEKAGQLSPKVRNHDSMTANIQSGVKKPKKGEIGYTEMVPLSDKLKIKK
jgi:hypothetical protein